MHRRVSFWLGGFVACFLVWARVISAGYHTGLTWRAGEGAMGAMRCGGATHFFYGVRAPLGFWHVPEFDGELMDLDVYFYPYQFNGMETGHVKVPDVVVVAGWLGLVGWWMVRGRRLEGEGM